MSAPLLGAILFVAAAALRREARGAADLARLEPWVMAGARTLVIAGLTAVGLALCGALRELPLAAALVLLAGVVAWRRGPIPAQSAAVPGWIRLAGAAILLAGVALRWPVIDYPLGGRDQGSYRLRAEHTARHGGVELTDPLLAAASADPDRSGTADLLGLYAPRTHGPLADRYEAPYRPGWYLADATTGRVVPQFFHLQPSLLAAALLVSPDAGIPALLLTCAAVSLGLCWAIATRLFGGAFGLLPPALLALSPLAIWTSRQTLTEPLGIVLVLTALLAIVRDTADPRAAGWSLGAMAWLRGNTWFTLPPLFLCLLALPRGAPRRGLWLALGLATGAVVTHAVTSFPYVHDEISRHVGLAAAGPASIVFGALGGALALAVSAVLLPSSARSALARITPWLGVALALLGVAVHTWLRALGTASGSRLDPLPDAVALPGAILGLAVLVARRGTWTAALGGSPWCAGAAASFGATVLLYAPANLPHASLYYYGRYLVPEILPGVFLLATWGVRELAGYLRRRSRPAAAVAATAGALGCMLPALPLATTPHTRMVEFAGAREALAELAERIPEGAVVLAGGEGWHHGHTFNQVGAYLAVAAQHPVLPWRSDEAGYAVLHELLVAPRKTARPRVFVLLNEATHESSRGNQRIAAFDDRLQAPFAARSPELFELQLDRLTPSPQIPTRVTRDVLRFGLYEVVVDDALRSADLPVVPESTRGGVPVRDVTWRGAVACLDPERVATLEIDVPEPWAQLVVVAAPGTAAFNEQWIASLDDAPLPEAAGARSRPRDTLGPWILPAGHHRVGLRGSRRAAADAACPHGGLAHVRLLPPSRHAFADAVPRARAWIPDASNRPSTVPATWVVGRGWSRHRPLVRRPAMRAESLGLAAGDELDFGWVELPPSEAPLELVVTTTELPRSPGWSLRVREGDAVIAEIDLPEGRSGTWRSPPRPWRPSAGIAHLRVELQGPADATAGARVWLRDVGVFAGGAGLEPEAAALRP